MMKHSIMMMFCITAIQYCYTQSDYLKYYTLIDFAKKNYEQGYLDSALHFYEKAFEEVGFSHENNLLKAGNIAKKLGQVEKSTTYFNQIKTQGKQINYQYKLLIDSLIGRDQAVRKPKYLKANAYYYHAIKDSTGKHLTGKKFLKSQALVKELHSTDSSNMIILREQIKNIGFPSEQLVGRKSNLSTSTLLLHYDQDTGNHIMGAILYKALLEGGIAPFDYAWIIDRHLLTSGREQIYFTIPFRIGSLTEEERLKMNAERKKISLKPLEEFKIIVKKNKTTIVLDR